MDMNATLLPSSQRATGPSVRKELPMIRTNTLFSASLVALATAAALSVSACSSGEVAVGSTEQALQKGKNGGPTGNGQTCSWSDSVSYDVATGQTTTSPSPNGEFKVGDTFKSTDGCNDCECTADGILCTLRACAPAPGGGTCLYNGRTYQASEGFRSSDNCNSCSCQSDGNVVCTDMACAPAPTCKKTGCSGQVCSDQDVASDCSWEPSYACYQTATCARQANGLCGFTTTPELTKCLADNP